MAKLLEKNGAHMMASLANIALPLKRLMDDEEFVKAWQKATIKGLKTGMSDILQIYADVAPLLFGEKHVKDLLAILAEIEGTSVKAMLEMDGVDLLADALEAFNEQLKPFFIRLGVTVGGKQ